MSSKTSASIGLAQLLNSEKYSDLKLVCQGQEFKVHKAIVCTQSPVLAAASNGSFQEAATNTINIDEFDAGTVKRMVVFMYGEDYDEDTRERGLDSVFEPKNEEVGIVNQDNEGSSLLTSTPFNLLLPMTTEILLRHIKVNAIADYYDIPQLKRLANTKIQNFLETNWSANNFSAVVEEAFNSTSDTALHKIITSTAAAHIEELVQHEDFTTVTVMSDFALGILRNMIATYKVKEELSAQKLQAAESRLQSIEVSYTYEKSLRDSESSRMDRVIENINDCLETLNKTQTCRNARCEAEFTCYIEHGGTANEPKYTLRCARCREGSGLLDISPPLYARDLGSVFSLDSILKEAGGGLSMNREHRVMSLTLEIYGWLS
ncbi:hypothetical protein G7Y89_g5550 [Cudoniella acicularis]|uniref:BTB domain-containing protein n=1 Tax=Cudoniella acicularis TaxID=354080 RepID=A0A8H4W3P7_9HELO|nr:hypothetical protein G7Y89_g5550 [Cudoniella acicularis]